MEFTVVKIIDGILVSNPSILQVDKINNLGSVISYK